jgi:hypothetical protein
VVTDGSRILGLVSSAPSSTAFVVHWRGRVPLSPAHRIRHATGSTLLLMMYMVWCFLNRETSGLTAWASPSASWLSTAPQVNLFCPAAKAYTRGFGSVVWSCFSLLKTSYQSVDRSVLTPWLHPVGGIAPHRVLPVMLDVGTNNPELLKDPAYVGIQRPRLVGDAYYELVDEFMQVG